MCGIAGFVELTRRRRLAENRTLAASMHKAIGHRGPDSSGVWCDEARGIYLSHRRLAIQDLSPAGAQPMATPDGRAIIVYNGEAYGVAPLRQELAAHGYSFRGHSDTEVILYGCQAWGVEQTVARLVGMFAFAFWDERRNLLSLVCDRLGKKPIYWAKTASGLLFASELRPLMQHPDCPRTIDRNSVTEFLRLAHIPAPHSILEGVSKVEPGHLLEYSPATDALQSRAYWSVADAARRGLASPLNGPALAAADAVEALLDDAVAIRLESDVPLGSFLSGGVDSSVVTALMQKHSPAPVRTFSIGFDQADYDESDQAEAVAKGLGTDHHAFRLDGRKALEIVSLLPDINDEPFGDASQIPMYLVAKLARCEVTVALSGDGGDEVFAGYNRHVAAGGVLNKLGALPKPIRQAMAGAISAISPDDWQQLFDFVPARLRPRSAGEKIHKVAGVLGLAEAEQHRKLISYWHNPEVLTLGGVDRQASLVDPALLKLLPDATARMRYLDLVTYLPGDVLTKVDRATMAASLEVRAPLLDHRLVELSWRIPSSTHLADGRGKWILREILSRHLPRQLFERPKTGFTPPIGEWLRGPLRGWAEDLLSEQSLSGAGLVQPKPVRTIWRHHLEGQTNAQRQLWPLLMLHAWRQRYASLLCA